MFLSVGVFGQAFDEDEPAPEKKPAPKAVIQERKVEVNVPAETQKPVVAPKQTEPAKAVEPAKTQETVKPAEPVKAPEAVKTAEPVKAPEAVKAVEQAQPVVPAKSAPAANPAEVKKVTAPVEADAIILLDTVCAITGASIKVTDKTPSSEYHGVRYYFVDEARKKEFEKDQWKHTKDIVTCQVCGKQNKVKGRGRNTFPDARYEGRMYFFCSNAHKSLFEAGPMQYIDADKMFLKTVLKKPVEKAKPADTAKGK